METVVRNALHTLSNEERTLNDILLNFLGTQHFITNTGKFNREQNSDFGDRQTWVLILALLLTNLARQSHLTSLRPSKKEILPSL